MKKFSLVILIIMITIIYTACNQEERPHSTQVEVFEEVTKGDFVYRLYSEKEVYEGTEKVKVIAELVYVGNQDSITISHASSPFYFPMKETSRNYEIHYNMTQPLIRTTLKRGEPLKEVYERSGGFSEQDDEEYVEFIKDLWKNGLPTGNYVVNGYASFNIESNVNTEINTKYLLKAQIKFIVNR